MNQFSNNNKYDLEERTAHFGANYMEANGASSRKDFKNKIFIAKKEAQETKHWLRMIGENVADKQTEARKLWQEAQELTLIFQKITSSLRNEGLKIHN